MRSQQPHRRAQVVNALATLNVMDAALSARASAAAQQWMAASMAEASLHRAPPGPQQGREQQQQQQREAGAGAVLDIAWAFATTHNCDDAFFQLLCRWLASPAAPRCGPDALARLFDVQTALTDAAAGGSHPGLLSAALPPGLLVAARAEWLERRARGAAGGGDGSFGRAAGFQGEVYSALQGLGLKVSLNIPTACGMHVLDAIVRVPSAARSGGGVGGGSGEGAGRSSASRSLALSLDGPGAFAANAPRSPLGATAARWRALQARGLRVSWARAVSSTQLNS
jgi:hypothetical protein